MLVPAVNVEKLDIKEGTTVAIVGKSGSGKSTLVDLLLGVRTLSSGSIEISGLSPLDAVMKFPGSIGYVSQETFVGSGTLEENLRGDYLPDSVTEDDVDFALDFAQLREFRNGGKENNLRQLGQSGQGLSGGQKQRLGIAKAILTRPKLLILDEATSALDAETEFKISEAIRELRGKVTVIIIAHRLSTIKNADLVVYLDNGEIKASGTFAEVRTQVPDFDVQAKLMAL
jgi:ABC-type bacteriocin/lantibiotic exporter with double-glycine peptidase domain